MQQKVEPSISEKNFILQQGFSDPPPQSCHIHYSTLLFQPRIVGITALTGVVLQSPAVFLALSAVLWWSALLPAWNPFDALYKITLGARPGAMRLTPAPAPRKFAQGLAGSIALLIAVSLLWEWKMTAYFFEIFLLAAVAALAFGRFCLGSFLYHLLRGRSDFARKTLPWIRE